MNTNVQNIFLECHGIRVRYEYDPNAFRGGLHATSRVYCPFSHTGFYSCPPIEPRGEADIRMLNALLDDHSKQTDRERATSIRRAKQTLTKRPPENAWLEYVTLNSTARDCFQMGIFANDADRVTLWRLAYRLYETALDHPAAGLPNCRFFKIRFPNCDIEKSVLMPTRLEFEALRNFMRGEVPASADLGKHMGPLSLNTYAELPPRPDGEPIIEIPTTALDFSFIDKMPVAENADSNNIDGTNQIIRKSEAQTSATHSTQMELF